MSTPTPEPAFGQHNPPTTWRRVRHLDSTTARALEMHLDSEPTSRGEILQFWRDLQLYNLREACMMLCSHAPKSFNYALTHIK